MLASAPSGDTATAATTPDSLAMCLTTLPTNELQSHAWPHEPADTWTSSLITLTPLVTYVTVPEPTSLTSQHAAVQHCMHTASAASLC